MKTAIIYYSAHHSNTKKLLDAISAQCDVDLIDALSFSDRKLDSYDVVGFASGIYFSKFHQSVLNCAKKYLPNSKKVFFIYTAADPQPKHIKDIKEITDEKSCECVGQFHSRGHDSYGPLKLIGGIFKSHPNANELAGAVSFYKSIYNNL